MKNSFLYFLGQEKSFEVQFSKISSEVLCWYTSRTYTLYTSLDDSFQIKFTFKVI